MRIALYADYSLSETIWGVNLEEDEQKFLILCPTKSAALALRAAMAGAIEVHSIEDVEDD